MTHSPARPTGRRCMPAEPAPPPPGADILLVDDRPADLLALEAVLAGLGDALLRAASGEEALAVLAARDVAVVLLDVRMPGLSGFETARRMRASERTRHTPVIFLSADDSADFPVVEAYRLGAVDYLVKPLVPDVLRAKVAVFVDLFRKGERLRALEQAERARAEEALRETEQRFARFMAHLPGLAWIKDEAGRYLYANDAAERAFGTPRADLYGRTDWEVFPADTAARFRENDERAAATPAGVQEVEALTHPGGEVRHSLVSKFPIPGPPGRPALVGGVAVDVTESLRATAALRESEERYRALVGATSQAVWSWSPAGGRDDGARTQQWWTELTGQTPEELAAGGPAGWLAAVHPADRERVAAAWGAAIAAGAPYDAEYRVRTPAGGWRHVRARGVPVRLPDGAVREWVGTLDDVTDARLAEEARAQLAAIVESSDDAIVSKTLDGVIRSWNAGAERLFGYPPGEAVGRPITLVIPPDRLGEERDILARLVRGERIDHFETVRVTKDGRPIDVSITVSPLRDAAGRVVGASKVARDVTERNRAAAARQFLAEAGEALAASLDYEATLAAVARLVVPRLADWCGVHVAEPDGRLRQLAVAHADQAKTAWAENLARRYPPAPDAPRGVPAVVRSGEPEFVPEVTDDMLAAGARDLAHLAVLRGLGLRSAMTVPLAARGRTLGAITFAAAESGRHYTPADLDLAIDLGRRAGLAVDNARLFRESQEALRLLGLLVEASGRLTGSLDPAAVRAAVLDLSHRLVAADAHAIWRLDPKTGEWAIAESAGLSAAYLRDQGRTPGVVPVPDRPIVAEDVVGAAGLESRRAAYRAEGIASLLAAPLRVHGAVSGTLVFYYRTRRRFDEVTVRVASALADLSGAALGTAELYEREAASRRRAEEADRRKDEFLAMLAHELRNPLAPLRNALQILALGGGDPGVTGRVRAIMDRQVTHLTRLVDDLLDVSRVTSGKVKLRPERLDLARLARQAAVDHRPAFDAKRVTLGPPLPGVPVWVSGDPTRLAQVVDNLLANALKFTPEGGEVLLAVAAGPGGRAVLSVRDTGAGIEPDVVGRLFVPFHQADRTLDRSAGGLGLGLAIVKGLAELHGGSVLAESAGAGRGATFTVTLPAAAEPAALAGPPPAAAPGARRLRVLVVEDNRDSADSLRMLIDLLGHEVDVAYTGPDGVRAAGERPPQVVICDIGLPGLDGYGVAAALRRNPATAASKLIALTGYGQEEDRRRAREAGFDEHLTKPADPTTLTSLLAAAN